MADKCPPPIAVKLGWRQNPRKLEPNGYKNMGDVTPMVQGACAHKGDPSPTAECAADEGCGPVYDARYGEPQAYQDGPGFSHDSVERTSGSLGYVLNIATNSEELWANGRYQQAGRMRVCVSFPNLTTWRCQDGEMGQDGKMSGFGQNNQGFDLPK